MIKVTLADAISAVPALESISQHNFNGINAFKIARLIRELNKEVELFNQERRNLIEKYCERDKNGEMVTEDGNIRLQESYIDNFNNTLQVMLDSEIEINASPLKIDSLEDITLTPQQAMSLEPFFEE